jgi:chromosomal replication initiator protein
MTEAATALRQKWDRVSQRLRAELGEDLFSSWFARVEPEELIDGRLAVSVPTRFLKNWIETHYLPRLHKTSEAELGPIDTIQVRVRSNGVPPRQAEPPARKAEAAGLSQAAPPAIAAGADRPAALDPSQTFDSFIVGTANRLAHAAVLRVADANAGAPVTFNPLFIHAAAGLGKTHLLNAVAQRIRDRHPTRKVLLLTRALYVWFHPGFAPARHPALQGPVPVGRCSADRRFPVPAGQGVQQDSTPSIPWSMRGAR